MLILELLSKKIFQNLHTKIAHQLENAWVTQTCNFWSGKLGSTKRSYYPGSKTSALSVQTESCLGHIFMVSKMTMKTSKGIVFNFQNSSVKYSRRVMQRASVVIFFEYSILMETTSLTLKNTWWLWTSLNALTRDKSWSGHSGQASTVKVLVCC